jgi:DNA-binding protein WhiA
MSFSTDTKNELARVIPEKNCCKLAEIAGFLRVTAGFLIAGGGRMRVNMTTDNPAVARHFKGQIKEYFDVDTELEIEKAPAPRKGYLYILTVGSVEDSESILRETGMLMVRQKMNYISDGIFRDIIRTKCCRKAYLRGIFLGAGTISDPQKGYHLEIVCRSATLAKDLRHLINTFDDLTAKVSQRGDRYVVYMKNFQYIRDTLAIMKAYGKVLELEDVAISKEMRNQAVRLTNCDTANTDRTLDASENQRLAIRKIRERNAMNELTPKLRELAELREQHPDASLTILGEMMDPPLKKSGVNNRMKRILEYAEKL